MKPITKKVNTLWLGKVGIPDRYIKQCIHENLNLEIIHNDQKMIIPFNKINDLIAGYSEKVFTDKYNKYPPYYLIYFNWKPTIIQYDFKEIYNANTNKQ